MRDYWCVVIDKADEICNDTTKTNTGLHAAFIIIIGISRIKHLIDCTTRIHRFESKW